MSEQQTSGEYDLGPVPEPPGQPDYEANLKPDLPIPSKLTPMPKFGGRQPKPETRDRRFQHHTLVPGRLIRFGVLDPETDSQAQDQEDEFPNSNLHAVSHIADKGVIRKDPVFGEVMWRTASFGETDDQRFNKRTARIGWRRDAKGQFTIPLMNPRFKAGQKAEEELTLGL